MTGKGDEMLNEESMETIKPVPQRRIADKMNEYMSRRDYAGAERHLLYWLAEAELGRDLQGQLMLRNEMVGHYRKTAQREKAMESAGKALELLAELGMEDSISAGTTYVNIATACNAFGEYERSLELFEKARAVYEGSAYVEPRLLGGLYNNMALTCTALSKYDEALDLYEKAIAVMAKVQDGEWKKERAGFMSWWSARRNCWTTKAGNCFRGRTARRRGERMTGGQFWKRPER